MRTSVCPKHHAVGLGRKSLSDAVHQNRIVRPRVTVRHQIVRIAESRVISRVIIHLFPAIKQVETVLVGKRMASRTESARTETQRQVVCRMFKIAVHHHFAYVFVPLHFRSIFRKRCIIGAVSANAINAEQHIIAHIVVRIIISGTFVGIPSGITVARFPREEICKSRILSSRDVPTFAHVTKSCIF